MRELVQLLSKASPSGKPEKDAALMGLEVEHKYAQEQGLETYQKELEYALKVVQESPDIGAALLKLPAWKGKLK